MHENTKYVRKQRAKYKALGLCYCGREIDNKDYKQCSFCRTRRTPEQEAVRAAEYRKKNRHRLIGKNGTFRRYNLKRNYGITVQRYDEMWQEQNGVCAICGLPSKDKRGLCVDHDHLTGEVRKLLCTQCNFVLGMLYENADRLDSVKAYIIRYK